MLEHGQIIKTLEQLNELHNTNPSSDGQQEFYSKLALLGISWIEECMDEIVLYSCSKKPARKGKILKLLKR